jgi:hypothetical protein
LRCNGREGGWVDEDGSTISCKAVVAATCGHKATDTEVSLFFLYVFY